MLIHNFNAGPAALPGEVLYKASKAVMGYGPSKMSILELPHRSEAFKEILDNATRLVRELTGLDESYHVLFLQGGGRLQFSMVPMNFLREGDTAAYTDTGLWAALAAEEAAKIGEVNVVGSSREDEYRHIPKNIKVPARSRYLHITTNNTIYGTQWNELPKTNVPLVADMSSDILGREMDYAAFDLIYAVAQKNIGIAGVTMVIVKDSFLKKANKDLPGYLSYNNHVKAGGLYNTAPVFNIYVTMLMLEWIKEQGGVKAMHRINEAKSQLIYNTLEQFPFVDLHAAKADRSMMNVVFDIKDKGMKDELLRFLEREKIEGVQGHRSVGGFRISLYNGVEMRSVETLAQCLNEFSLKKA